jgi:multicomponent Na+:H+ antiporter subunit C
VSATTLFGLCAALAAGLGLYGVVVQTDALRRIVALNVFGSAVFLIFGVAARRGAAGGLAADPVPHAMVITGLVVAFVSTALAVALLLRLHDESAPDRRDEADGA